MSVEDLYEFISGENQAVTRILQYPAGTGLAYIRDTNRVKLLGYNIEIWSAETGGVQLVEDTDYTLGYIDSNISTIEGFTVWAGYQVTTPAYQGVNLYITASIVGGYTSRPYRPTYETITANATFTPSSVDDSAFVDASAGAITLTLADGTYKNQRVTVICSGENPVTVSGTALTARDFTDISVQFIWAGAGWLQSGGGGDLQIQIPQPKTFVDKGVTPAQSITNQWGEGLYIIDVETASGLRSTQILNVSDVAKDWLGSPYTDAGAGTGTFKVEYRSATNDFYATQAAYTSIVISSIYRWELDPDNLPVQQIPGDPSLVPTYVLKWGETIGDTPADTVSNIWGEGLFFIGYNYQYGANRVYSNAFMGVAFDGENREILFDTDITGADSIIRGVFDYATTSFQVVDIGNDFSDPLITSIFKYEAAAIGELNPPVDGWETVYNVPSNTLPVPNAWGAGAYEITYSDVIAGAHLNVDITITEDDILSNDSVDGASLNSASNGLIPNYIGGTTNAFDAVTYGIFVGNITKIRKFSGLLNVVHSYESNISEIDTTAGDVAVVLPTPAPGMVRSYYNIGTGGNHVTGLPDGITLGDGKGIAITYGGTGWRYEDVPIDDYSIAAVVTNTTSAIAYVKKWAGGAMSILYAITAGGNTGNKTITHPEIWVGPYYTAGGVGAHTANAGRIVINRIDITPMDTLQLITDTGAASGSDFQVKYEGRWK